MTGCAGGRAVAGSVVAAVLLVGRAAGAQAPARGAASAAAVDPAYEEARAHFEKGNAHAGRDEWLEALDEFRKSLELKKMRTSMAASASALKQLGRYDEALDEYERVVREYPDLPPSLKAKVTVAMTELSGLVGTLVLAGDAPDGAMLFVDERPRGKLPLAAPLRVAQGRRAIRVEKEGFAPIRATAEVRPGQESEVRLVASAMRRKGRLSVSERHNWVLPVELDGKVVGVTPWEGPVEPGEHQVRLRGFVGLAALAECAAPEAGPGGAAAALEGAKMASPTETATVRLFEVTRVALGAEEQDASLRIEATPSGAQVRIDGKGVGRAPWEGRLSLGEHAIEVSAGGFVSAKQSVQLVRRKQRELSVVLQRDPSVPVWKPGHFTVEALGGLALAPPFGGDTAVGCTGDCSQGVGLGGQLVVHGGYELGNGVGFGVSFGYLSVAQDIAGRKTTLDPVGLDADHGLVNHTLQLRGFRPGMSTSYRFGGERFPIRVRLGAGALLGTISDTRTGSFRPNGKPEECPSPTAQANSQSTSPCFTTGPVTQAPFASFLFVEPEVRVGFRIGDHMELSAGIEALLLFGMTVPSWDGEQTIYAGTDGIATFKPEKLARSFVASLVPGLGVRYDF